MNDITARRLKKAAIALSVLLILLVAVILVLKPFGSIASSLNRKGNNKAAYRIARISYFFDRDINSLESAADYLANSITDSDDESRKKVIACYEEVLSHKDVSLLKDDAREIDEYEHVLVKYMVELVMAGRSEEAKEICLEEIESRQRTSFSRTFFAFLIANGTEQDARWAKQQAQRIAREGPLYGTSDFEIQKTRESFQKIADKPNEHES